MYGADAMVECSTRVYEAMDEEGHTVAIKDAWRDKDRKYEAFQDIRDKLGEKEETKARKYLVAIRTYEDVVISRKTDKTLELENAPDVRWITINTDPPPFHITSQIQCRTFTRPWRYTVHHATCPF
jgi:hypothetical protein